MADCFSLLSPEDYDMDSMKYADLIEAGSALVDGLRAPPETVTPMMTSLAESLQTIFRNIALQISDIFEVIMVASAIEYGIPAKWLYIYRHTKKRRTKKKYRKLIFDASLAYMEEQK